MSSPLLNRAPAIAVVPVLARGTIVALLAYTALAMALEWVLDDTLAFGAGPVTVYAFDVLLLVSLLLLFRQTLQADGLGSPPGNRSVVLLILAYCAYQLVVILPIAVVLYDLNPISVGRDLVSRISLVLIPFVYLVVLKYVSAQRLILLVNVVAVLLALFVLYRYATVGALYDSGFRLRQVWGGATLLFAFLILTSVFLVRPSLAAYCAALLGLVGLVMTNHRSGYVALFAVAVPLFFHFRRASVRVVTIIAVVAASAVVVLMMSSTVRESAGYSLRTMLDSGADSTAQDRIERSRLGLAYFAEHPLGDYAWSHRYYLVDFGAEDFEPHNFVAQVLAKQGLVGLVLILAMCFAIARIGWRNRSADRTSVVMLACFLFYLVFCLFNTNLLNQWNVMLLVVPAALILQRNTVLSQSTPAAVVGTPAGASAA
jgi:O-antigen ligase